VLFNRDYTPILERYPNQPWLAANAGAATGATIMAEPLRAAQTT
jgi:hypothetical protein